MLNIAIIDDVPVSIKMAETLIGQSGIPDDINYMEFTSSEKFLKFLNNHINDIDILVADIMGIGDINGVSLGKKTKEMNNNIIVIYISASIDYMKDLLGAEPFAFINKPIINYDEFFRIFLAAYKRVEKIRTKASPIFYKYSFNKIDYKLDTNKILYFRSDNHVIRFKYLGDNEEFHKYFRDKLNNVNQSLIDLKAGYIRPSKSYLVNQKHIKVKTKNIIIFDDGTIINDKFKDCECE